MSLAGHGIYAIIEDTATPQPPRNLIFPIKFAKQAMGKIETHNSETGEITATLHTPDNQQLHVTATLDPHHPPQAGGQLPVLAIAGTNKTAICAYYLGAPVTTKNDPSQHNVLPEQPITTTAGWFPTHPHEIYEAGFSATDEDGTNLAFAITDSIAESVQEHLESGKYRYCVSRLFRTSWCNKYDPAVIAAAEDFHTVHSRSGIHDFMRRLDVLSLDEFTYYPGDKEPSTENLEHRLDYTPVWETASDEERQIAGGSKRVWEMNELSNRIRETLLSLDRVEAAIADIRQSLTAYRDTVEATPEYSYEQARDILWYQLRGLIIRGAFKKSPYFLYPELNERPWDYPNTQEN